MVQQNTDIWTATCECCGCKETLDLKGQEGNVETLPVALKEIGWHLGTGEFGLLFKTYCESCHFFKNGYFFEIDPTTGNFAMYPTMYQNHKLKQK